jgi:hypothetical protein
VGESKARIYSTVHAEFMGWMEGFEQSLLVILPTSLAIPTQRDTVSYANVLYGLTIWSTLLQRPMPNGHQDPETPVAVGQREDMNKLKPSKKAMLSAIGREPGNRRDHIPITKLVTSQRRLMCTRASYPSFYRQRAQLATSYAVPLFARFALKVGLS